ncbi:MAG: hypothetical protein FWC79_02475 [Oscillospiraceae bacterium]|nr:hypothetical protein [Oscillospiraceae bacterium]
MFCPTNEEDQPDAILQQDEEDTAENGAQQTEEDPLDIIGSWILESAVEAGRVRNGEAASIRLLQNGTFELQPYAASGRNT